VELGCCHRSIMKVGADKRELAQARRGAWLWKRKINLEFCEQKRGFSYCG